MNIGGLVDRRSGEDRRDAPDRRLENERRSGADRRLEAGAMGAAGLPARHQGARPPVERRGGQDRRDSSYRRYDSDRRANNDRRAWAGRSDADRAFEPSLADIGDPRSGALMEILSGFHEASADPKAWPKCLVALADALGAKVCAIASHDYETGSGRIEHSVYIPKASIGSYAERYGRLNIFLQQDEYFRAPGAVWTDEQILMENELVDTPFYTEWLKPLGLHHHLFGILDRRRNVVTYLFLGRGEIEGPFSDTLLAMFRRLLPSLQRAYRSGQSLHEAREIQKVASSVLDVVPIGVIIAGTSGNIIEANQRAKGMMAASGELSAGKSGLEFDHHGRRLRLRDLIAPDKQKNAKTPDDGIRAFSIQRPSGQKPLSILIAPVDGIKDVRSPDEPAVIVFLGDPGYAVDIDQPRLCELYGLTRAEARVAALLANGYRLEETAESLGLVYETARKHLKHVFGKTGTDRQAELIRMLVTGPAVIRL
jgi:DNA-binding CsgD family transcriptional regulator/PAS domain-containing protein